MAARIILWDLMDTLVSDPFFRHMPEFFGLSLEELIEQKHPTAWLEFERGEIDEAELAEKFFQDGRAFDLSAFKEHIATGYQWLDGMPELVRELHARGVPMHLLSNYPAWYTLCTDRLDLARYVAPSFISCETGVRKPDAEAYLGPCRALDVPPSACLFVDDREKNCAAARALGMPAFRFQKDVPALRRELQKHGLL
jgi:HAD superfamily hydrolase (TIGR01509 family)